MPSLLRVDNAIFERSFPARPFIVEHALADHPLFQMERLIELSRVLPDRWVEYNAGDLPVSQDPTRTPRNGLTIQQTIEQIETCRSWLVLKHVEVDADYGELLHSCLNDIAPLARPRVGGMFQFEGFIFITSAGSTTPFHVDPEHNFLLQVRGSKTVNIFDATDRSLVCEEELEHFYNGGHRNLEFSEAEQAKAEQFVLNPGVGLHFPVNAPHWVRNGNAVSISFSITFRSPLSRRNAGLYAMNGRLRRLGLRPKPVGTSAVRDGIKHVAVQCSRAVRRAAGVVRSRRAESSHN